MMTEDQKKKLMELEAEVVTDGLVTLEKLVGKLKGSTNLQRDLCHLEEAVKVCHRLRSLKSDVAVA